MKRIVVLCLVAMSAIVVEAQEWTRLINAETFGLCINPLRSSTIYVGGIGRRLYRTYDAGKTWDTLIVDFPTATTRFTNVYVSPADTNVIIVAGLGFGTVRRSSDHGNTWNIVIETLSPFTASSETVVSDPHNPNTVYAADLRFCNIYRSYDRGATWDTVGAAGVPFDENLCTLTIRHDSSNVILAGMQGGNIKRSVDSGKTWIKVANLAVSNSDAEVPRIVFSKRNPMIGYAIVTYLFYPNRPSGGLHLTTDGGFSWKLIAFPDTSFWTVAVRTRNDNDDVFVGGFTDDFGAPMRVPGHGIVRRSTDGGASWLAIDKDIAWSDSIRRNVWMMKFAGDNDERVYMATERGFFVFNEPEQSVEDNRRLKGAVTGIAGKQLRIEIENCLQPDCEITVTSLAGIVCAKRRVSITNSPLILQFPELSAGVYSVMLSNSCGKFYNGIAVLD